MRFKTKHFKVLIYNNPENYTLKILQFIQIRSPKIDIENDNEILKESVSFEDKDKSVSFEREHNSHDIMIDQIVEQKLVSPIIEDKI